MKMWIELFGSFAGQLSLAVILFMIGMAIFFIRLFVKKSAEGGQIIYQHRSGFLPDFKEALL